MSLVSQGVVMIKECVNRVDEGALAEGLRFQRQMFHSDFATPDLRGCEHLWRNAQLSFDRQCEQV
jgi:hypothetical protein